MFFQMLLMLNFENCCSIDFTDAVKCSEASVLETFVFYYFWWLVGDILLSNDPVIQFLFSISFLSQLQAYDNFLFRRVDQDYF